MQVSYKPHVQKPSVTIKKNKILRMKNIFLLFVVICLMCSCSVFKRKTGCPVSGAAIGAERIASGDRQAIKAANKSKFKGGRKIY